MFLSLVYQNGACSTSSQLDHRHLTQPASPLQPPKIQPKTYILPVKTHKLTFFITAAQTASIASLKAEVLSALSAPVLLQPTPEFPDALAMDVDNAEWTVPRVQSEDDFELCRGFRDKGRFTGRYERLIGDGTVKTSLVNWETLFVQFRDMESGEWCILYLVVRDSHRNVLFALHLLYDTFAHPLLPMPALGTTVSQTAHDPSGTFHPVKVEFPKLLEDDENEVPAPPEPQEEDEGMSAVRKGKRKARAESPTSDD